MQASPSKARAEALEAQSWSIVHSWLSDLYHPSPAPFVERNPETLKALQTLMTENIAADHVRALVRAAQKEEVTATTSIVTSHDQDLAASDKAEAEAESTHPQPLVYHLESSLSRQSKEALDSLAESAVLLGCPTTESTSIIQRLQSQILDLPRQTFALETQLSEIDALMADLRRQISRIQRILSPSTSAVSAPFSSHGSSRSSARLDSSAYSSGPSSSSSSSSSSASASSSSSISAPTWTKASNPPLGLGPTSLPSSPSTSTTTDAHAKLLAETLQHQREIKQLALKCEEYQDRIASLERQLAASSAFHANGTQRSVAEALAKQDALQTKKAKISALETKIRAFHGLPPDLEASRAEVHRAQTELDALKVKRDALFERMGG
ncbi:hypothetical protein A1O1_03121 [Capronia coronata CBS 617.96]|uniref:HAUS augmin-like complex subunit 1 n=1 Tax=Capronia coronata CBS 617.96 TaxID=1182541 RepID=W9ZJM3_9EURO|nr:uncharacterized protein A1O1_03121 [Capronia coronata CBS 617.96]EXJ94724.1 hypothetical protein A1O1_03121 [Capronia coronata CBS 617.96]